MKLILYNLLLLTMIAGCGSETNIYSSTEAITISNYYLSPNPVPAKASTYFNFHVDSVSDPAKIESVIAKIKSNGVTTREYGVFIIVPFGWSNGWLSVTNPVTFMTTGTYEIAIQIKMTDGTLSNELSTILKSI